MKKILNICFALILGLAWTACEDDLVEKAILNDDVAANVLSDLPTSAYILLYDESAMPFDTFEWTTTDFGFEAAVAYTIQLDASGSNFTNAEVLATTHELSATVTNGVINTALLNLGMAPEVAADVDIRILSDIGSGVDSVYSSTLTVSITPYATTFPPIYVIGDAQNSWSLDAAAPLESLESGIYEGLVDFVDGGYFRFFASPDWSADQWGYSTFDGGTLPAEFTDAGDGDSNFIFVGTGGNYKVTVDFNSQTIILEAGELPTLYIIGDDQDDWSLPNALLLESKGNGVFEGLAEFTNGSIWRFFDEPDWGATQYYFTNFTGGITGDLSEGGDANFLNDGATGVYRITVDLTNLTVVMTAETAPTLFTAGDQNGWSFDQFTWVTGGVYTGSMTLTNGNTFRFFGTNDWVQPQYGHGYFEFGVDADLGAVGDGDDNFVFNGADGTYNVTVNLYTKTIEIE